MIDHITLSNELADLYIDQSARVHYEFFSSDYTKQLQITSSKCTFTVKINDC
jgi:hypothetical protein